MSNTLADRLRCAGYKVTPSRMAVLDVISRKGEHLSPQQVLEQAEAVHAGIGRATVYRTLELLTRLGIVRPIYVGEDGPIYIPAQGAHHHLVCSRCGRIVDFERCTSDELAVELSERFGFDIHSHLLEFYGICADCRQDDDENAHEEIDAAATQQK